MKPQSFQSNRSVAVYGGSFDPLHVGHVEFIQKLINELKFQKVIVVPCKQHPFDKKYTFTDTQRLQMLTNVFSNNKKIEICDFEIKSNDTSFTIKTLEFLKLNYPKMTFVSGADAFEKIETWREYKRLFDLADFLVVKRSGNFSNLTQVLKNLSNLNIHNIETIDLNLPNISSSDIRLRLEQGLSIEGLLPKENRDIKKL